MSAYIRGNPTNTCGCRQKIHNATRYRVAGAGTYAYESDISAVDHIGNEIVADEMAKRQVELKNSSFQLLIRKTTGQGLDVFQEELAETKLTNRKKSERYSSNWRTS